MCLRDGVVNTVTHPLRPLPAFNLWTPVVCFFLRSEGKIFLIYILHIPL